jgi:exodeoxyribonuclease V alpha subunit
VDLGADPVMWAPEDLEAEAGLPWPQPQAWIAQVAGNPLVASGADGPDDRPLRLVGSLLYLQRYWQDENAIRTALRERSGLVGVDPGALSDALARLFPQAHPDQQRLAAATAALRRLTIIAGGPGTGKTTSVARLLELLAQVDPGSVALAAPTGKAAARLQEAVAAEAEVGPVAASTLHRLLGWRPDARGRFRHDRSNPLPHDVVVVDETSMVSLPMMARLLEAVRPDARVILVGDPDQLASIDAGAVLGDLVAASPSSTRADLASALTAACPLEAAGAQRAADTGVVVLDHNYRFGGAIADLAQAIRHGDPDAVVHVLRGGHADVEFLEPGSIAAVRADVVEQARRTVAAARAGDATGALSALGTQRVLCAHREGRYGVTHWNAQLEEWTAHLTTRTPGDPWYVGRPLLVTANDYTADLYNGDTGVVIATGTGVRAAFARADGIAELPVAQLDAVVTLRAMTIHRGQGSQFDAVTVVLPPADSPLLTRELLYTAVTRARSRIRVLGTEEAVRAGVQRQVRRASGLRF